MDNFSFENLFSEEKTSSITFKNFQKSYSISDYKSQFILNKAIEEVIDYFFEVYFIEKKGVVAISEIQNTQSKIKFLNENDNLKEFSLFVNKQNIQVANEFKEFLNAYSGYGAFSKELAQTGSEINQNVLHEFYTEDYLIQKMWALATKFGHKRGNILEPSVGTGRFLKYTSNNDDVLAYEISLYSAVITSILYLNTKVIIKGFETHFYDRNKMKNDFRNNFDLVIGNPPYSAFGSIYAQGEQNYFKAKLNERRDVISQFEHYFILRSLDCLKKGGLLVFVVPSNLFNNEVLPSSKKYDDVVKLIKQEAELLDAYILPNSTFKTTNVNTCLMVLRKK